MGTKVGVDIPIRKTYLCVLLCIWKCMYAFMYVESLGLLPKSANSAEGNLFVLQGEQRDVLGHHQHMDCCLQLMDMSTHPSWSDGSAWPSEEQPRPGQKHLQIRSAGLLQVDGTDFTSSPSKAN